MAKDIERKECMPAFLWSRSVGEDPRSRERKAKGIQTRRESVGEFERGALTMPAHTHRQRGKVEEHSNVCEWREENGAGVSAVIDWARVENVRSRLWVQRKAMELRWWSGQAERMRID